MTEEKNLSPKLKKIVGLLKKGQVEDALELADQNDVEGLSAVGDYFWKAEQYGLVICIADRLIQLLPDHPTIWFNRGNALAALGRHRDALGSFRRVLELDDTNVEAMGGKAFSLANLGQYEDALKVLDQVLNRQPNNLQAVLNRGAVLSRLGRHKEAAEALDKAAILDPESASTRYRKGIALAHLGRPEEALVAYDEALELDPAYAEAWHNRGSTLGQLGHNKEALEAYARAARINPKITEIWYNKGVALAHLGRLEEALEAYNKALELNPNYAGAWLNKGVVLGNLGLYEEALAAADTVAELDPSNPKPWFNRAGALLSLLRYEEAKESFEKARECYLSLGKEDEAKSIGQNIETATNAAALLEGLKSLDRKFARTRRCKTLNRLRTEARDISSAMESLAKEMNNKPLPAQAAYLMYSRAASFSAMRGSLESRKKDSLEAHADSVTGLVKADIRFRPEESKSLEEPVKILRFRIGDGVPAKEWVTVCLVQLDFKISERPPRLLESDKEEVKRKVFTAIEIAIGDSVDIICFPELSFTKEWAEEIRSRQLDMMVVCGSYYTEHNQNVCEIVCNGTNCQYAKCHPSIFEQRTGEEMNPGNFIPLFQTKWGKVAVLNCIDFNIMRDSFVRLPVDILINPRFDIARDNKFLEKANDMMHTPEGDKNPLFILVCNAAEAELREVRGNGGTAIISYQDSYALPNFEGVGLYPENSVKYNVCQARGEMMITAALRLGPIKRHRARIGNLYLREGNEWIRMPDRRIWPNSCE